MSIETRDQLAFERYLEYQRSMRPRRIETLGGAATVLALSVVDLGVSDVRDPDSETHGQRMEREPMAEITPLRAARQRRLAAFAADETAAELGYAQAA